jgi:DNA-binding transcriptional ArsR family regulator
MDAMPDIASVARLLSDRSRALILLRLLDGSSLTATELAHHANISPQTASSHLGQLRDGGLLSVDRQGRQRYFRLSGPEVAHVIESMMAVAPHDNSGSIGSSVSSGLGDRDAIHRARTCYDHLAGRLGVLLTDAMLESGWLAREADHFRVSNAGEADFRSLGIDLDKLRKQRRHFARPCLDWSERRHHLAGALGAALAQSLFERKWLLKAGHRIVHVTDLGRRELLATFGVKL